MRDKKDQILKYKLTGAIVIGNGTTLEQAQRHVASLAAVARGLGAASATYTVPRMTNVDVATDGDA